MRKNYPSKLLTTSLAAWLLFNPISTRKVHAENIKKTFPTTIQAVYDGRVSVSVETNLEVNVELNREKSSLEIGFFTEGWEGKNTYFEEHGGITNDGSLFIVVPKGVKIGKPQEKAYTITRAQGDEKVAGTWQDLKPIEESSELQRQQKISETMEPLLDLADSTLSKALPTGVPSYINLLKSQIQFFDDIEKKKRDRIITELNNNNYEVYELNIYPTEILQLSDKLVAARTFSVPLEGRLEQNENVGILFSNGLEKGGSVALTYGKLMNQLVTVGPKKIELTDKSPLGITELLEEVPKFVDLEDVVESEELKKIIEKNKSSGAVTSVQETDEAIKYEIDTKGKEYTLDFRSGEIKPATGNEEFEELHIAPKEPKDIQIGEPGELRKYLKGLFATTCNKQAADLCDQGKYEEAAEYLREGLSYDPENELLRKNLDTINEGLRRRSQQQSQSQRSFLDSLLEGIVAFAVGELIEQELGGTKTTREGKAQTFRTLSIGDGKIQGYDNWEWKHHTTIDGKPYYVPKPTGKGTSIDPNSKIVFRDGKYYVYPK